MDNKQFHLYVSGLVQGVGFRFSARILANRNNITGWVKNLPDGRVELMIQGKVDDLDSFLKEVKKDFKNNIAKIDISESKEHPKLDNFNIYL